MHFEGMLADHRQDGRGDAGGIAGDDFEIGEFVGRLNAARGDDDGQVAEARILGQHGEEGVDHARR